MAAPTLTPPFWIRHRDTLEGYAFLFPFLVVYAVFLLFPFFKGIWISLHSWNLLEVAFNPEAKTWIGLANFLDLLTLDRRFWDIVLHTLEFVFLTVPTITIIGLLLAVALNRETRAMAILRTLFFLSQVLSVTVVTLIWQLLYSPQQGLIGKVLEALGLEALDWVTSPDRAMPSLVIVTVWWSIGFAMILFLAGLQEIPQERYEAARLDGASRWRLLWHITLPGIRRTTTLVVIFEIILHFQVFGQSHLITRGGPNDQTQVLVRYIYQTAFRDSELGYASALAMVLFFLMLGFSVLQLRLNREDS